MPEISLEQTHALLKKLAEYVMNEVPRKSEVPTKQEMNERFTQVDVRFERMARVLADKADKKDIEIVQQKLDKILEGMDSQVGLLDIIRTEQYATSATLDRHEQRLGKLEANIDR
jgi:hypothetical protein